MKKPKPKIKIGVCKHQLCRRKTKVFLCKYCGKYFCKKHIKPKPILDKNQILTVNEPLKSLFIKIWKTRYGHLDQNYTSIFFGRIKERDRKKEVIREKTQIAKKGKLC